MNKTFSYTILIGILLSLVACGGNGGQDVSEVTLPIETQLVVGTFKLEDTELAVTAEQAGNLLMFWQVYVDLGESDTAAQAEIDALVEQVQETMTAQQVETILSMQITQQDVVALVMEQGDSATNPGGQAGAGSAAGGASGFAPPDGGMEMGGGSPPDGGMMGGGEVGTTQPSDADQQVEAPGGEMPAGMLGVPSALLDALIQLLEQRARA